MIAAAELEQRSDWVMRRNVKLLLAQGRTSPDFYFGRGEGALLYHIRLDALAPLMNSGRSKEILFSIVRHEIERSGYDCVIFASDMYTFKANDRARVAMDEHPEAFRHPTIDDLVERGYGEKVEAITVTGQTSQITHCFTRRYFRDLRHPDKVLSVGEELARFTMPQENFGGRMKMFGDWGEPGMREAYQKVGKIMARSGWAGIFSDVKLINIALEEP